MSQPLVPPRPQRAQQGPTAVVQNTPDVPPRPSRRMDPSPARSPLNDLPASATTNGHIFYGQKNLSATDLPRRPPSVQALPMVGQEGDEYASFDRLPPEAHGVKDATLQTRHADVPIDAPTASIPSSTAKSRISAVTRTDSSQAAAAGVTNDEAESLKRVASRDQNLLPLKTKSSFNRSAQSLHSGSTPRPASIHSQNEFEHGIPVIGMQVPMYPNAGDVQAPSPQPHQTVFPAGVGFFNDGSQRAHSRRRSSRHEFGPPGSYGLHGHPGQEPGDQFEREWIAKHPDIAAKEGYNVYGGLAPRPASALTSDQLNRLVREGDDIGFGTDRHTVGTPDQEIGYLASEMYSAHISSAKPSPTGEPRQRPLSGVQAVPESPLRKTSFPFNQPAHDNALDSEDEAIFHVDPPERRRNKITGGGEADGTVDFGPRAGNTAQAGGWFDERGPGIPILASDEISKRPGSAYLQPAVSPEMSRRDDDDVANSRRSSVQLQGGSRPSSRPSSTHGHHAFGGALHRFVSQEEHHASGGGTPLEEIEEYEPLFPEDDKNSSKILIKEKLRQRPQLAAHHFPSQDVWEDTPASLQFTADVDTPEPARERIAPAAMFESPEMEHQRRSQNPDGMSSDAKTFAKPHFRGAQQEHERPGVHRFPSQDVWEDTADSARLVTTVTSPQSELSPPEERPTTSAIPLRQDDGDARASTGLSQLMRPYVPARPRSKLSQDITADVTPEDDSRGKDVPDLGAKTKPAIPARPARTGAADQADPSAAAAPKVKPAVPARPAGNKLAGLRANFMNDLNNRLQLGPQAPPSRMAEADAEPAAEEKAHLTDARKGRAKGPARRKAAPAPSAEAFGFSFSAMTLWHIDEEDELKVHSSSGDAAEETTARKAAEDEALEPEAGFTDEAVGHPGDKPNPSVSPAVVSEANAVKPELEQALASAEPAPESAESRQAKSSEIPDASTKTVSGTGPLDVKAPEDGNVAIRDGEEVGRTD